MYLLDTTKEKILNVKDYYEKRDLMVDAAFFNSVLDFIQKDALFKDSFHYELTEEKKRGHAYAYKGVAFLMLI